MLAPRPAQAQGSWYGFPCDSQGNPLPNNTYNNGFYTLYGPQSGTASNTYPLPMINAALAYPSLYGDYLYAATPSSYSGLGLSPHAVSVPGTANFPNDRVGAETPGFAFAGNYGGNGEGSYSVDAAHGGSRSGPIIGSVTADLSGQLVGYFKMYWSGSGTPTAYADFLVSTSLYAQASVSYGGSQLPSGLSASATASDGAFNETASASAGSGASSGGVPQVSGRHLVQAAVDPKTGIAEVYVTGKTHWVLSNMVPYATGGATWASGGSLVEAGAIPDSREITLYQDGARSPGKVYSPDGQLHGEYVDASGVGHGETTYSTQQPNQPNWQYFHPTFLGKWTQKNATNLLGSSGTVPDVTWSWSPNESEDTWDTGKCEMPNSGISYNSDGTSSGKSAGPVAYPVTYTATDNGDHATAAASYALTVHDQWDNLRLDPSHPFDAVDILNPVQINGVNYPLQVNLDYTKTQPVGPLTLAVTIATQLSFQPSGTFKLSNFLTLGGSFTASASVSFAANQTVTGPAIPPRCYVQLMYEVHYHKNHWFVDHYLTSGYDNTYMQLIDAKGADAFLEWGHPIQLTGSGLGGA